VTGSGKIFAARVVEWQRRAGRQDLPWQGTRDPYRIWLSEIMLQQTQVATVIPYYRRFLARFPDVRALASGSVDDVLQLWSGLGYYSRGRNLHLAARVVMQRHAGTFPTAREALEALPGIGRSTAAAISVFSAGAREAILDGNVKRVLARCFAVAGFPGEAVVQKRLWSLAQSLLPEEGIEPYTQGLMDLGATLCTRTRPRCGTCPLAEACEALKLGKPVHYPAPKPRKALPHKTTVMLLLVQDGRVLLQKRPPAGIWGGLWSLPEFDSTSEALESCRARLGIMVESQRTLQPLKHGFTHYSLTISPLLCVAAARATLAAEPGSAWWAVDEAIQSSIPAPVRTLLRRVGGTGSS
jgi:A/G-specific adenine glycosylase